MRGQQQVVERGARRQDFLVDQLTEVGQHLVGQHAQLDVGLLGAPLQQFERRFVADPVDQHQHALGLLDRRAVLGDLGDRRADQLLARTARRRHVDVEAVRADHVAVVVVELVADHDHVVHDLLGVDDAVAGAECPVRAPDVVQRGSHLNVVVGMLVRQHQFGRGHDGARLVPVQPLHLFRPLPPFVGEVEAEPPDPLRRTPG